MTHDIETLRLWLTIVLSLTAIGQNAVVIVYLTLPWRTYLLGRIFMLKSISFAATLDVTLLFQVWKPSNILVLFWTMAFLYSAMAASTGALAWWTLRLKLSRKEPRNYDQSESESQLHDAA
jgi:hypothetical protein